MMSVLFATHWRHVRKVAATISLAACALTWAGLMQAGQLTERFDVNITLTPAAQTSSVCTAWNAPSDDRATVSVVCGPSGAPGSPADPAAGQQVARGDAYRVLSRREEISAGLDGYGGAIATTAVRVVNLPGRQYIEMTVGW